MQLPKDNSYIWAYFSSIQNENLALNNFVADSS